MCLVRVILANDKVIGRNDWRVQSSALMVLQMAAEVFMVSYFKDAGLCVIHIKHVSVMPKDTHLALHIRREKVVGHNIESTFQLSGARATDEDQTK